MPEQPHGVARGIGALHPQDHLGGNGVIKFVCVAGTDRPQLGVRLETERQRHAGGTAARAERTESVMEKRTPVVEQQRVAHMGLRPLHLAAARLHTEHLDQGDGDIPREPGQRKVRKKCFATIHQRADAYVRHIGIEPVRGRSGDKNEQPVEQPGDIADARGKRLLQPLAREADLDRIGAGPPGAPHQLMARVLHAQRHIQVPQAGCHRQRTQQRYHARKHRALLVHVERGAVGGADQHLCQPVNHVMRCAFEQIDRLRTRQLAREKMVWRAAHADTLAIGINITLAIEKRPASPGRPSAERADQAKHDRIGLAGTGCADGNEAQVEGLR